MPGLACILASSYWAEPGALSDIVESALGRMSASPSGVFEKFRCDDVPYLPGSEGDMNWAGPDAGPPGVVGV